MSLVLAASGCSGSGTSDKNTAERGSASASPSVSAASSAGQPLTAAELKKAALTQAELSGHPRTKSGGGYTVKEPAAGEIFAEGDVKADREACAPVARAASGVAAPKPSAVVYRQVTSKVGEGGLSSSGVSSSGVASSADPGSGESLESAFNVSTTFVTLASYADQAAAAAVMKSLTDAIAACGGGFTGTVRGEKQKVAKVAEDTAPDGADEAAAFTVTSEQEGTGVPLKVVVLRKGATVAGMTSLNMASALSGKDYEFPSAITKAQLANLT